MLKLVWGVAAIVMALGLSQPALADPAGSAKGVHPDAEAQKGKEVRTLVVGSDLFIGDRVVTGPDGEVQILFSDNTRLVVGPRSAMVLDDYLLRENGSAGKLAIDALNGTFRFVTGGAAKDRYVIKTPTGTIGVRGTAFELFVTDLFYYLMGQEGATINCPAGGGECTISDNICEIVVVTDESADIIGHGDDFKGDERERLKEMFTYAVDQSSLKYKFRITNAERCLRKSTSGLPFDSLSDPGTGGDTPLVLRTDPPPNTNCPSICNNVIN